MRMYMYIYICIYLYLYKRITSGIINGPSDLRKPEYQVVVVFRKIPWFYYAAPSHIPSLKALRLIRVGCEAFAGIFSNPNPKPSRP